MTTAAITMTTVSQCETWKTRGTVIPAATLSSKVMRLSHPAALFRLPAPCLSARHQKLSRSGTPASYRCCGLTAPEAVGHQATSLRRLPRKSVLRPRLVHGHQLLKNRNRWSYVAAPSRRNLL